MKKEGKHIEVEDIVNSLEGMKRASPADDLFEKVLNGAVSKKAVRVISLPAVSVAAAGILLLITVNITVLSKGGSTQVKTNDRIQEVANYYDVTSNAFGL